MKAIWGLVAALTGPGQAWAQAPSSIVAIALNCASCHSDSEASSIGAIPSLNRSSSEELRQTLLAFKSGAKMGTLMPRLVKGYSDRELSALADYLGKH